MSDYIKREDVIDIIDRVFDDWEENTMPRMLSPYSIIIRYRLSKLPSADVVERKRGEWIVNKAPSHGYGDIYICPFCEGEVDCLPTNFCPWCGADMREREGE